MPRCGLFVESDGCFSVGLGGEGTSASTFSGLRVSDLPVRNRGSHEFLRLRLFLWSRRERKADPNSWRFVWNPVLSSSHVPRQGSLPGDGDHKLVISPEGGYCVTYERPYSREFELFPSRSKEQLAQKRLSDDPGRLNSTIRSGPDGNRPLVPVTINLGTNFCRRAVR